MATYLGTGELFRRFPDDAACLDELMRRRFGERPVCPGCGRAARFARLAHRRAHACPWCGYLVRATAGTAFAGTRVPLQLWFYALWWSVQNRGVPSARALRERLGVSYATAWRMAAVIRRRWPAAGRG